MEVVGSNENGLGQADDGKAVAGGSLVLLIGSPVAHSVSPALWNAVFNQAGIDWHFRARDVAEAEIAPILERIRTGEIVAAFVTMPFKSHVAQEVDRSDVHVRRSRVANFVRGDAGALVACNTDAAAVRSLLSVRRFDHALILGAGGAARGALSGIVDLCGSVTVTDVSDDDALRLCQDFDEELPSLSQRSWADRVEIASGVDLIINATPLGMDGLDESPLPKSVLSQNSWVYDFVYRLDRRPTPFEMAATAANCRVFNGMAHLEEQAVQALPHLGLDADLSSIIVREMSVIRGSFALDHEELHRP